MGLNSDLASMGLLAGRTDSDLLTLFSYETEVDSSSREEMESRESLLFFFFSGPLLSMAFKIERIFLVILVLDREVFLREVSLSSEEEGEEESLDFRFDFLREDEDRANRESTGRTAPCPWSMIDTPPNHARAVVVYHRQQALGVCNE